MTAGASGREPVSASSASGAPQQPTQPAPPSGEATVAIVRSMLDKALAKNYQGGVVGVRARPTWSGPESFLHRGQPTRVVLCRSALAVREALRDRSPDRWLVVITDRDDIDLGAGILARLVFQRLRTPEPWDAVCQAFHASAVDTALSGLAGSRQIALGLLDASPAQGWPPAPGGVLTREHALGAVAHRHLLSADSNATASTVDPASDEASPEAGALAELNEIDATSVWTWTARTDAARRIAELRVIAGDSLTAATLAWLASRTGASERAVLRLWENGGAADAVPLGLLLGLLADTSGPSGGDPRNGTDAEVSRIAQDALVRLEVPLGGAPPTIAVSRAWTTDSRAVTFTMLQAPTLRGQAVDLLDRADRLLAQIRGAPLAAASDLLPSGLTARLEHLARALSDALVYRATDDPDQPLVATPGLEAIERAWAAVEAHALAGDDERVAAFRGGVRLARALARPAPAATGFAQLLARHRDHDGWADAAFTAAARGVGETSLGNALQAILVAARARRDGHDRAFATALAQHTADDSSLTEPGLLHIEDVLATYVMPLARVVPVLLVILDGMSLAAAIDVVQDATGQPRRWQEVVPVDGGRRVVAVAALPTDTHGSRTSLLCGEVRTGGQNAERDGLADLGRRHRVERALLYHRGLLEESRLGMAVSDDVAAAIADVEHRQLVACVLNTIDDALDRADPGGTTWTVDAVRHLRPLLRQAWQAGRCVVLTADHGHVIDRRDGIARPHEHVINARARAASQALHGGAAEDEVLLAGRRVLAGDGRAVFAANERLRYVSRRAGYHGGAAPAEVVVPFVTLIPGDVVPAIGNEGPQLRLAPDQEPWWWRDPNPDLPSASREVAAAELRSTARSGPEPSAALRPEPATEEMLPLFGDEGSARSGSGQFPDPAGEGERIAARVFASTVFRSQERMTRGRGAPEQSSLNALLTALIDAPGHRLTQQQTATALGEHPLSVRRAVMSAIRLLNVEGYPVLSLDSDGTTTVLDVDLLREQFGV